MTGKVPRCEDIKAVRIQKVPSHGVRKDFRTRLHLTQELEDLDLGIASSPWLYVKLALNLNTQSECILLGSFCCGSVDEEAD